MDSSANDSMDGIKEFRISSKIQEDIPPEDLDTELYANYKLGTNANKENDQTYLGTGWIYSQGSNPDQNKIDLATWISSFGEYSLQTSRYKQSRRSRWCVYARQYGTSTRRSY